MVDNDTSHFSTRLLISAFTTALLLSAWIYLAWGGIRSIWIEGVLAVVGLWLWLGLGGRGGLVAGFFVGVFWFWWVSLSFRYFGITWAMPFGIVGIGLIYGVIFWAIGRLKLPFKALAIGLGVGAIWPFGFNWLQPELLIDGMTTLHFLLMLTLLTIGRYFVNNRSVMITSFLAALACAWWPTSTSSPLAPFPIQTIQTNWDQEILWSPEYQEKIAAASLASIEKAAASGARVVVLPESAFPFFLESSPERIALLQAQSKQIAIIAGSIRHEHNAIYNTAYLFDKGVMRRMDKVIPVPFGEATPLPSFLTDWLNHLIFNGAQDYAKADHPSDFTIDGVTFRSAICFEATRPELYEAAPAFMIAISNNGWFTPSPEAVIQERLLRYFARTHKITIYHATNQSPAGIIR